MVWFSPICPKLISHSHWLKGRGTQIGGVFPIRAAEQIHTASKTSRSCRGRNVNLGFLLWRTGEDDSQSLLSPRAFKEATGSFEPRANVSAPGQDRTPLSSKGQVPPVFAFPPVFPESNLKQALLVLKLDRLKHAA